MMDPPEESDHEKREHKGQKVARMLMEHSGKRKLFGLPRHID